MYHYQQTKCETKSEVGQYMRITGRYGNEKSKKMPVRNKLNQVKSQTDIHG